VDSLAQQRCFNHSNREAVARCPECERFFCRECVTEHEDRVVCARCLASLLEAPTLRRSYAWALVRLVQCVFSLFLAWAFFCLLGQGLLALPSSFHETGMWQGQPDWEQDEDVSNESDGAP